LSNDIYAIFGTHFILAGVIVIRSRGGEIAGDP